LTLEKYFQSQLMMCKTDRLRALTQGEVIGVCINVPIKSAIYSSLQPMTSALSEDVTGNSTDTKVPTKLHKNKRFRL